MRIAMRGQNIIYLILNRDNRYIESTTSEIKHDNLLLNTFLPSTISQCSSSRLVNDPLNLKTGNSSGINSGSSLGIIEVGRNGNNSIIDFFSKVSFGSSLHLLKDHGRHFLGCKLRHLSIGHNLDNRLIAVI